jgi:hypothetical protein
VARAIHLAEEVGHWLIHYPSYLWLLALLGRLEIYFFVYSAVSAAYLGRSLLQIGIRLGGASAYAAAAPSQAASPAAPAKASPAMPAAIDHQHEVSPP